MRFQQSDKWQGPRIIPTKENGYEQVDVSFQFQDKTCSFSFSVPKSIYNGAVNADKTVYYPKNATTEECCERYYVSLATDKTQYPVLHELLSHLRKFRAAWKLTSDEYFELIVLYVQSLPYDEKSCALIGTPEYKGARFSVEVIVDGTGICCESSMLLAALLNIEGYAAYLLSFNDENHMVVGIPSSVIFDYKCCGYAIIETVAIKYVGDASSTLAGIGHELMSNPIIFKVGEGKQTYNNLKNTHTILQTKDILTRKTNKRSPVSLKIDKDCKDLKLLENDLTAKEKTFRNAKSELEATPRTHTRYNIRKLDYNLAEHDYKSVKKQYDEKIKDLNHLILVHNRWIELLTFINNNICNRKAVVDELKKYEDIL